MVDSEEKLKFMRVDLYLVELSMAPSRSQAALLIKEKKVFYRNQLVEKASLQVTAETLEVKSSSPQYVGRGAHKLVGALNYFQVKVENRVVADMGASTGGFTQVMLERGAARVYAIDVGHGQLAPILKEDPRVINREGVNIRSLESLPEVIELAVVDLSYISLTLVLKEIFNLLTSDGEIIALVKPQFEVGPDRLGKKGLVKKNADQFFALQKIYDWCLENDFVPMHMMVSPIFGKTGNREFFYHLQRKDYAKQAIELTKIKEIIEEN